jgi:hypothetical protein
MCAVEVLISCKHSIGRRDNYQVGPSGYGGIASTGGGRTGTSTPRRPTRSRSTRSVLRQRRGEWDSRPRLEPFAAPMHRRRGGTGALQQLPMVCVGVSGVFVGVVWCGVVQCGVVWKVFVLGDGALDTSSFRGV